MSEQKVSRSRRWDADQASAFLAEIDRRGISVSRFAAEKGFGAERLYRWKRLLRRGRGSSGKKMTRFAEVTVRPGMGSASIEIELSEGIVLRVAGESRVDDAVALVSRLGAR